MSIYWLVGLTVLIFCLVCGYIASFYSDKEMHSYTLGFLASILFVLIMIYDKL
mgnify:CR=1